MHHVLFKDSTTFDTAILIKKSALKKDDLIQHYVDPLKEAGIPDSSIIAFDLEYNQSNKAPVGEQKKCLDKLLPALKHLGVKNILVCDAAYFKTLTKEKKAEPHYGYVVPCRYPGFEDMHVALVPNYQAMFYNPDIKQKLDLGLNALIGHLSGTYTELGADIVHSEAYPEDYFEIKAALEMLYDYPELTCDIEAFSLNFWKAGIGTIGFAWDEHNGIAFPVDYAELTETCPFKRLKQANEPLPDIIDGESEEGYTTRCAALANQFHGYQRPNEVIRKLLREFFENYSGEMKLIWHNASYDLKVIVNTLWMKTLLDEEGKQFGMELMTRNFEDTKIITYLATNSTAGNKLSLKDQAHEFAGNWAQSEINDIRRIPKDKLLRYNLVDCLSTWYVRNKHWDTMVADQQLDIYQTIMKPSVKLILQMELTGMPLNMEKVKHARRVLEAEIKKHGDILANLPFIQNLEYHLTRKAWEKDYADRKAKAKNPDKIQPKDWDAYNAKARVIFNPGSNQQLQYLLYEMLGLPVIDYTKTKQPAVGGDTLKKLANHTHDEHILALLGSLKEHADASKILNTFVAAFEGAVLKEDGWYYLHGNFNLGGTVSGRLSSSGPNLQNIPSTGSKWAKLIKECFQAPPGKMFAGADFASLEDRISALTTKDPNKLKVYTDGYDGHCLRAFFYFGENMPDIQETVESINSIAERYKAERQDSKPPTFALTYQGTWHTLVNNLGWSEDKAKMVEARYHEMYQVSDEWVQGKLQQASKDGYVTVAFGLRVRTPLLKQVLWNSSHTPYEAQKEGRTAGNALGQSYGLLNNRAGIDFQERTLASPYRYAILPSAHIHDAQYFIIDDDIDAVHFTNTELGECMKWQELPEIYHPDVPLGGELDLFYPNWAHGITLPNGVSQQDIFNICDQKLSA